MSKKTPKELISMAQFEFILSHPFLGDLSLRLITKEAADKTKTMSTDARNLFYNSRFVKSLSGEHLLGVLAHEISHCVFGHAGTKGAERGDKYTCSIWNMACEFMANHFVIDMCCLNLPGEYYYDEKYSDGKWTTEDIYYDLLKQTRTAKTAAGKLFKGKIIDDHSLWGKYKADSGQDNKNSGIDQDWKIWIAQAFHSAKRQGKLPAGLERLVEDILEPQLNWRQVLAEFLLRKSKEDYSWARPNKRSLGRGIITPALYTERLNIAYAIDTSGSMSVTELSEGLAEIRAICSAFNAYTIHFFACDADVHSYQELAVSDSVDIEGLIKGGGGTDFRPVFEHIKDNEIQLDALIYFTDGDGTFPEEDPGYPVLWVIKGKSQDVPFGRCIEYGDTLMPV